MTDTRVQADTQSQNSTWGQHARGARDQSAGQDPDRRESLKISGHREVDEEPLSSPTDAFLSPPSGGDAAYSCDLEACSCLEGRGIDRSLQSMQLQLQFFMRKADDLHDRLVNGHSNPEREALAAAVRRLLYTCQPYFNHLESTARGSMSQDTPPSFHLSTMLLDFSQQMCDRLERLISKYASYNLLCLDETDPHSVSHFYIGQRQLGRLRLTMFRYCKPTPYLARVDTGLYKCMRWNVERLHDEQVQTAEGRGGNKEEMAERVSNTEYYFLCYEDIPNAQADRGRQGVSPDNMVRMWSIGQWVQVNPDPDTEDLYNWIMCEVPQGNYHRLLSLGSDEPSNRNATDLLLQVLLSHQTTD
ncbi:UPF0575 protein C19orf67 homolog [Mastacembelus armatus]|uniref:UPF0575 protein C19orf67 homolog n=1 Tax=Mastacembelus armatus TaxID=205130 RepID=UPI000E459FAB|nr:UPF0575 protein C19orf67 homolog [Mastacembelus armatus]